VVLANKLGQRNGPHALGQRLAAPVLACGMGEEVHGQIV
jgi:hypothetical protein